ncbi:MAG TPA: glycosyltransferase family 4 protein [Elusimicrobiota bacterium]|nr:glycosyltransferase family 4 protein [Elusimicrobiota bacterium]
MNIAMLLETLSSNNGVSRIALSLGEEFIRRGHEMHIYASVNHLPKRGRKTFADPKIHFHWLPSLRGSWRTWSLPLGALSVPLAGRLPGGMLQPGRRHDVIVSHALTLRQDVIQIHNDPQKVEEDKLARVPFSIDPPPLRTARRKIRAELERLRFSPGNYRGVIAHSRRSARETGAAFGIPEDRIDVIPHGVDSGYFSPSAAAGQRAGLRQRLGLSPEEVAFLYVGDSWKCLEFAIRGLARLPARAPKALLAVGPFPKKLFARFAQEQGVRFLYEDLWEDLRSIYSVADVLLNPTPLDTFSLISLEAMSMGLPIVTTQYAGISELLTHGSDAFVLESPSDPVLIAEACLSLLEPDVRRGMAQRARKFALSRSWEQAASLHLRHYSALQL